MKTTRSDRNLRLLSALTLALGTMTAFAGLFWTAGPPIGASDLYGQGLYRRDTIFVAGGAQGSDLLGLCIILPAGLWAIFGQLSDTRRLILIGVHTWWLYLSASLTFGAIAFNEAFPLYVALMPLSLWALIVALQGLTLRQSPRGLPAFLIVAGVVTGLAWGVLLWIEMTTGAFPPETYYTVRTTYAADLGLIAPGCVAAGIGLARGRKWGTQLGLPLLWLAALLLPMMVLQTIMQLRAGVAFGPEAVAPFVGFGVISAGALWFLVRLPRHVQRAHNA
jgi:hypothetical protein